MSQSLAVTDTFDGENFFSPQDYTTSLTENINQETYNGIILDYSRDNLLTDFGKETLKDRYLLDGENYQQMFARVASAYADDLKHAQRIYDYISKLWFMPATPVLSNGGTTRGLPISCYLNEMEDSLEGIVSTWNENVWLAANGGGIGTYVGKLRSIGENVKRAGRTSGVIPFIKVVDSITLAIGQGSLRRGSAAVYIDISHPEIEEFIEIRKPTGDSNRRALNTHHGVNITDEFMEAVAKDEKFALRSPKTNEVIKYINARTLWQKILEIRLHTGEPYLIFIDTVNRSFPAHQKMLGLKCSTSNLCSEITLHTGEDHNGMMRTAVCCLSSVNAEKFLEWKDEPDFIEDVFRFLDNVLEDFIERAPDSMSAAKYAAKRERSVGLGVMGYHSFLQSLGLPFEGVMAKSWNRKIFSHLKQKADAASVKLAEEKGPCLDALEGGVMERFSHKIAIAPTASISIICGGTSACIEPIPANVYTHKTLSGTFSVRNRQLSKLLEAKGMNNDEIWVSIAENQGSVQHLDFLSQEEKDIFKTAFEIDQRWVIDFAADRSQYICQSQSVNIFIPGDVNKWDLHMLHWTAWKAQVKSLYYCRSRSVQRSGYGSVNKEESTPLGEPAKYQECLSCQ